MRGSCGAAAEGDCFTVALTPGALTVARNGEDALRVRDDGEARLRGVGCAGRGTQQLLCGRVEEQKPSGAAGGVHPALGLSRGVLLHLAAPFDCLDVLRAV